MNAENAPLPDDSPEVRALLRAGISDEADYDFEKGLSTHLAAIGAMPMAPHPAGAPGAAAAGAPAAAAGLSTKALLALVGIPIASASVVAALWFRASPKEHQPAQRPGIAAPIAVVAAPAPVVAEPSVAAASPTQSEDGIVAPAPDQTAGPLDRSARGVRPSLHRHQTVTLTETPEVAPGAETGPVAVNDGNSAEATQPGSVSATNATAAPTATPSSTPEETRKPEPKPADTRGEAQERLAREMDQLVEAKRALASDPRKALLLAEGGQREFPHSVFAEERQQILLLALIGVGRVDDARRLAAPYLQSHPDSPFAQRVQRALAGK